MNGISATDGKYGGSSPAEGGEVKRRMWLQSLRYSYIGIFFGVSVVLGFVVGNALDKRFHSGSLCTMVGVLFGIASGFKELYRLARNYQNELTRQSRAEARSDKQTETKRP